MLLTRRTPAAAAWVGVQKPQEPPPILQGIQGQLLHLSPQQKHASRAAYGATSGSDEGSGSGAVSVVEELTSVGPGNGCSGDMAVGPRSWVRSDAGFRAEQDSPSALVIGHRLINMQGLSRANPPLASLSQSWCMVQ
jgi:hypothetical protein